MVAHTSVASSKPEVELDSHADMCVVGDNCLIIDDHNRPVNVCSYSPQDSHKDAKTVDATVGYQDPQSGLVFIVLINQAIYSNSLENHLICHMQCLNGVHISDPQVFGLVSQCYHSCYRMS